MNNIKEFIERKDLDESLDLELKPLSEYIEYIENLGFEKKDEDTNGWQIDFWVSFDNDLVINGSLYYGDYTLSWNVEDDN